MAEALRARQIDTWVYTHWDEPEVQEPVQSVEMVIAIGGDGAMLRAARVCAPYDVPLLGVNMGQLGFLTEVSVAQWDATLDRLLQGDYWIEYRMMLHASVLREGKVVGEGDALNDTVISGSVIGRMIQLETYIDRDWTTTYKADALIIATATGSTAYALACGGPILPPELRNILIVPAAPHLSMDRPIVLSEGATVEITASSYSRGEVVLLVDGTILCRLNAGDRVRIHASEYVSRFVRLRERNYFYRSLLDRLEPRIPRAAPEERKG
jgi:NAD+ kinase